jgi:hypothetical protein
LPAVLGSGQHARLVNRELRHDRPPKDCLRLPARLGQEPDRRGILPAPGCQSWHGADGHHIRPEPDAEIPANVSEGLLGDGIDVRGQKPQRLSAAELADASYIVSFGYDISAVAPNGVRVERWDDCPAVSDDYGIARDFITGRVENLLQRLKL